MKRSMIPSLISLGMLFAAPAWSHHPAEGIVSDDIWLRVDSLLESSPSQHLDIDFDEVMDSMGVILTSGGGENCQGNSDCGGRPLLVTSAVVLTEDVDDYLFYINMAIDESSRFPMGKTSSDRALTLEVEIEDLEDELSRISVFEPVGSGESQDDLTPKKGK